METFADELRVRVFGLRGVELSAALAAARSGSTAVAFEARSEVSAQEAYAGGPEAVRFARLAAGSRGRSIRRVANFAELTAALSRQHTWRRLL